MESVLNAVGAFLVGQSCQLLVVFAIALVGTWCMRNHSAHWRYCLWLLVIGKCLTPSLFSLPLAMLPDRPISNLSQPSSTFVTQPLATVAKREWMNSESTALKTQASGQEAENARTLLGTEAATPQVTNPGPRFSKNFNLGSWVVLAWVVGAIAFLTVLFGKMIETQRRLRQTSLLAGDQAKSMVARLASKVSMKKIPAVYLVEGISQPFVWGWLRGNIYLPTHFDSAVSAEQRVAILKHELAHIVRWDAAVNLFQMIVQSIFFFHPLVWWANRNIRRERENCCDEMVLADTETSPRLYCEAIVEMLSRESRFRQSTPMLAVTGSAKNVEARIKSILSPHRTFKRGPSLVSLIGLFLISLIVLPTALVLTNRAKAAQLPKAKPATEENTGDDVRKEGKWQPKQEMEFRVIHALTKEPIEGVWLELQNMGEGIDFSDVKVLSTDADGKSIVRLPDLPPSAVRVYPSKPGFVPLRVYWEDEPWPVMPKTITIPMHPGKTIGGTVRDERGKPISGVKVSVDYWAPGSGVNPHVRDNICRDNYSCKGLATTDEQGKWIVDVMPEEIVYDALRIFVEHPDFVSDRLSRGYNPLPVCKVPSVKELFSHTAVMTMTKGEPISGLVSDESGAPISGAKIYYVDVNGTRTEKPSASTTKDGVFHITNLQLSESKGILVVEAEGYAPELVEIQEMESQLQFTLEPGHSVEGLVVDKNGKPIEGADVFAQEWRGKRGPVKFHEKTDANGKFRIKDVPSDEVNYDISKEGYMMVENYLIKPGDEAHTIALTTHLRITGSVVDADTNQPIEKFSFVIGADSEDGRAPHWFDWKRKTSRNGRYEVEERQAWIQYRIRIEADGYMPGESTIIRGDDPDNRDVTYDFKLRKADTIKGSVIGLDGKPLVGAKVYLATERMNISDRHNSVYPGRSRNVTTGESGKFEFQPEVEPFCIVVIHEQGVGMIIESDLETSTEISIRSWNKKNQRMQIIRRPAEGELVDFPN